MNQDTVIMIMRPSPVIMIMRPWSFYQDNVTRINEPGYSYNDNETMAILPR